MPRFALSALLLAAASPAAFAQPVIEPPPAHGCSVDVAHAPAEVRAAIESWVRAEPRCDKHLEVRVVPTAGGFYLLARDDQGRVRERVVPDAQSVAVLVTSWAADDTIPAAPAPPPPVEVVPPRAPLVRHPALQLDDDRAGELDLLGGGLRARPGTRHPIMLGGLAAPDGAFGIRGQIDVGNRGAWVLGISGAALDGGAGGHGDQMRGGSRDRSELDVFLGRSTKVGPLTIRAQLGLGAAVTHRGDMDTGPRIAPNAEASVLATMPLTARIGLIGGPILDVTRGRDDHPDATPRVFLGVQVGL